MSTPVPQENPAAAPALAPVLGVSELNRLARETLERAIPLLWVAGEVSNLTRAASGHLYFSLKDENAQIRCVMFRNRGQLLPFTVANGMQVEVRGLVTLYEPRGDFQLNIETMRRAGLGALFEAFTRLKDRLAREGLVDEARKRTLPAFPSRIGIVTSLQAAAMRDALVTLQRRAPHLRIVIYPVPVQGDVAAAQITDAINAANARNECDVLMLIRGGGSIEDLWPFNDELLARAIAASSIPTVTGIGHESDYTIADFVADHRAATPTAAAELVSAGWTAAARDLHHHAQRLQARFVAALDARMQQFDILQRRLIHPARRLHERSAAIADLGLRLANASACKLESVTKDVIHIHLLMLGRRPDMPSFRRRLDQADERLRRTWRQTDAAYRYALARLEDGLSHLNPLATLARGYSITYANDGSIVTDWRSLIPGSTISIRLANGLADASVREARSLDETDD